MGDLRDRLAAAALLWIAVTAGSAPAGPVNAFANATATIEEVEKAGAALQAGRADEALKLLNEAVRKYPGLPPARLLLARLYLNNSEGQRQGRATLEQAAAEFPDHPEVYLTLGKQAVRERRFSDALLNYHKALDLNTGERWPAEQKREVQAQARNGLADACEGRGDWAGARAQAAALLELDAKNGRSRQRLARTLFFLGKPDDAYAQLQTASKDDAALEPPAVFMAKLWETKGDAKMAREWLDRAVRAEPDAVRVHLAYADWLLRHNEVAQAKQRADAAAKLRPEDLDVQRLQGLIARVRKDATAAEPIFRRILGHLPDDFPATDQLALVLADRPDAESRRQALQHAEANARRYGRSADAQAVEALATLGYVRCRNGDFDGALQALQSAVAGGQASSDTAYYLALAFAGRGREDEARRFLRQALQAEGLFVYRPEARALLDRLDEQAPRTDARGGRD